MLLSNQFFMDLSRYIHTERWSLRWSCERDCSWGKTKSTATCIKPVT